jgi:hypothetical protein
MTGKEQKEHEEHREHEERIKLEDERSIALSCGRAGLGSLECFG